MFSTSSEGVNTNVSAPVGGGGGGSTVSQPPPNQIPTSTSWPPPSQDTDPPTTSHGFPSQNIRNPISTGMIGMRPPNNFHPPPMMMTRPQPQPGGMPPGIGIARPQMVMPGQLPVMHKPVINVGSAQAQQNTQDGSVAAVAAAAARPQTGIQCDWTEHIAPDGRKYYYNAKLRESKWEKPVELMTNPVEAASYWKEYVSPEGKKYYYNRVTKESRWTMPEEMKDAQLAIQASLQANIPVQVVKLTETTPKSTPPPTSTAPVKTETIETKPLKPKEKEKPIEEAKAEFKELLKSVGCSTNWTWDTAMRAIISDQRYGVLSSLAEKKACFNEFIQECKNNRIKKEQQRERTAKEDFIQLIEETPDITNTTRYTKAKELIGEDPRWQAFDSGERERVYLKYLRDRYSKEKQKRRKLIEQYKQDLKEYLQKQNLKVTTTWRKISVMLEGIEEFERLDRFDRLEVFSQFIQKLEKKMQIEKEKKLALRRRAERKNREAFKKLLAKHREDGTINAKTRWKEYGVKLVKETEYQAVATNKSGSRPRELFEDVLEEMEEIYEKDRSIMKEVYRKSDIVVSPLTTFSEFCEAIVAEDERMKEVDVQNIKIVYNELHYKAREREVKESKLKKKSLEEFKYCLKHSDEINELTTWEETKNTIGQKMELKNDYETDYEKLFSEYISKLRRKKEKGRKKESSDSDSDERNRKVHRRKKSRTSEQGINDENVSGYKKLSNKMRRHHSDSEEDERKYKRQKAERRKEKKTDLYAKRKKKDKSQREIIPEQRQMTPDEKSEKSVSEVQVKNEENEENEEKVIYKLEVKEEMNLNNEVENENGENLENARNIDNSNGEEDEEEEEEEHENEEENIDNKMDIDIEEGEAVREASASEEGELNY